MIEQILIFSVILIGVSGILLVLSDIAKAEDLALISEPPEANNIVIPADQFLFPNEEDFNAALNFCIDDESICELLDNFIELWLATNDLQNTQEEQSKPSLIVK